MIVPAAEIVIAGVVGRQIRIPAAGVVAGHIDRSGGVRDSTVVAAGPVDRDLIVPAAEIVIAGVVGRQVRVLAAGVVTGHVDRDLIVPAAKVVIAGVVGRQVRVPATAKAAWRRCGVARASSRGWGSGCPRTSRIGLTEA